MNIGKTIASISIVAAVMFAAASVMASDYTDEEVKQRYRLLGRLIHGDEDGAV